MGEVTVSVSGAFASNGSADFSASTFAISGTAAEDVNAQTTAGVRNSLGLTLPKSLSEGYYYATLLGKNSVGLVGTWHGSATSGDRTALYVTTQG